MIEHATITRPLVQRLVIILAVIVQIGAGFLPSIGIGEPVGTRSDAVRTLITPVGWAFAIWGPLFLLSALFALWQALPAQRHNALLNRIGWPAAIAFAAQGVWSTYTQIDNLTAMSVLIIAISLVCLLSVMRTLAAARALSLPERLFVAPAFSALTAWLSAATIVNVAATLKFYGAGAGAGVPAPLVATTMVAVGTAIAAMAVARFRGTPLFGLVFSYALFAISVAHASRYPMIGWACIAGIVMMLALTVWQLAHADNRHHWFGGKAPA